MRRMHFVIVYGISTSLPFRLNYMDEVCSKGNSVRALVFHSESKSTYTELLIVFILQTKST